ncbi:MULTISPECIES: MaoC family dehydratase [unclassified Pseudomonas]|uniref:MaoC family dehydratase n=1 Tax=unclassified Pseudomonas TaxID=196821 RepID=UPI00131BB2C1|nr:MULTISPECIES: MaoC family dehydratase [unclassified Pseudomonas]
MPSTLAVDLYYEDIEIGREITTATHMLTAEDVKTFAVLTRDHHPLHTDPDYCRSTAFGRVIAHGLHGLALMEGLKTELRLFENTSVASLGWNNVRFNAPIFPGDTLHVKVRFEGKRESRSKPCGIVEERLWLLNQQGEVVIEAEHTAMLKRRH